MNKTAAPSSMLAREYTPLADLTDEDTIPSTPYTPRNPYAPPGTAPGQRQPVGDGAGEHLWMKRGRFSAWPHVVIAFVYQAALVGLLCAGPVWLAASTLLTDDAARLAGGAVLVATGPAAAYFTFRKRWRCVEAFSSRFCVGLLNLSILYVPLVALVYANVRGAQKLAGR